MNVHTIILTLLLRSPQLLQALALSVISIIMYVALLSLHIYRFKCDEYFHFFIVNSMPTKIKSLAANALYSNYNKALGHDISKRFVTKFKRIVRRPSFR